MHTHTHVKELTLSDICIKNPYGQIIIDIYQDHTGTQQKLHFRSYHPTNSIKPFLNTLVRRICTIVSRKNHLQIHIE